VVVWGGGWGGVAVHGIEKTRKAGKDNQTPEIEQPLKKSAEGLDGFRNTPQKLMQPDRGT